MSSANNRQPSFFVLASPRGSAGYGHERRSERRRGENRRGGEGEERRGDEGRGRRSNAHSPVRRANSRAWSPERKGKITGEFLRHEDWDETRDRTVDGISRSIGQDRYYDGTDTEGSRRWSQEIREMGDMAEMRERRDAGDRRDGGERRDAGERRDVGEIGHRDVGMETERKVRREKKIIKKPSSIDIVMMIFIFLGFFFFPIALFGAFYGVSFHPLRNQTNIKILSLLLLLQFAAIFYVLFSYFPQILMLFTTKFLLFSSKLQSSISPLEDGQVAFSPPPDLSLASNSAVMYDIKNPAPLYLYRQGIRYCEAEKNGSKIAVSYETARWNRDASTIQTKPYKKILILGFNDTTKLKSANFYKRLADKRFEVLHIVDPGNAKSQYFVSSQCTERECWGRFIANCFSIDVENTVAVIFDDWGLVRTIPAVRYGEKNFDGIISWAAKDETRKDFDAVQQLKVHHVRDGSFFDANQRRLQNTSPSSPSSPSSPASTPQPLPNLALHYTEFIEIVYLYLDQFFQTYTDYATAGQW